MFLPHCVGRKLLIVRSLYNAYTFILSSYPCTLRKLLSSLDLYYVDLQFISHFIYIYYFKYMNNTFIIKKEAKLFNIIVDLKYFAVCRVLNTPSTTAI